MHPADTILPTLPPLPVVMPTATAVVWISPDGDIDTIPSHEARARLDRRPVLFCHKRWTATRLGIETTGLGALEGLDALELFAFVRPAQFCLPTPRGLAEVLGLSTRGDDEDRALLIPQACQHLLAELRALTDTRKDQAAGIASMMAQGGWGWAPSVMAALDRPMPTEAPPDPRGASIWFRLKEILDFSPQTEPGAFPISTKATEDRLKTMLGKAAEIRPSQKAYATSLIPAFNTPKGENDPVVVLAEAGTGTGKTLGYLAPATVWAEDNKAPVWVSTYTRSLQHQVVEEMARYYPEREVRDAKVVIRKGRENYLCLLNLEDALSAVPATPRLAPALGLMARWAEANPDGDLTGSGFPAWLVDLLGQGPTMGLADRRGECIHSACRHFQKCFVEKSRQKSKRADIVVANHALVMIGAAMAALVPAGDGSAQPTRYVFDEGHHVFDAADSAFSTTFSGTEAADLRRWIRGQEARQKSRARGLKKRLEDILAFDDAAMADLDQAMETARILPAAGWRQRLSEAGPDGPVEQFLFAARKAIYARASSPESLYNLEANLYPLDEELSTMALGLADALKNITTPLERLAQTLTKMLVDQADTLDTATRSRLEGAARGLMRRANGPLQAWRQLLLDVATPPGPEGRPGFVDWMEATRRNGEDVDIGLHRHYLDPGEPFSRTVMASSHGTIITSATLTDHTSREVDSPLESDWAFARQLTGAVHLPSPAMVSSVASPFDYASQTRILVVGDIDRDDPRQTAAAMSQLMQASGGGALGLFTAIRRLKAVHAQLAADLDHARIPLYAQHIDAMNLQTLLQIFREDRKSCLLGTDAVRDGIDVPGQALQLIIFDRVPWPRPDMLFKARAQHYGREQWSDRATRMKLRQAFGRLVRRGDDRGVFVVLDSRLPTRMLSAFPPGVEVERCGLADAVRATRGFLRDDPLS
ncbi:MAG: ATP-dependent DNA helicase [Alphaproteobacteria bacterium]|nr:ATP-dependent DNA helicase [Alphaproteobacteria bacterium]